MPKSDFSMRQRKLQSKRLFLVVGLAIQLCSGNPLLCIKCVFVKQRLYIRSSKKKTEITLSVAFKRTVLFALLKVVIDGSKFGRFSRQGLNFDHCVAIPIVKWTSWKTFGQSVAAATDQCILTAGIPYCENASLQPGDSYIYLTCVVGGICLFFYI